MTTAAGSGRTKQQQPRRSSQSAKQAEQRTPQSGTRRSTGTQRSSSTQQTGGTQRSSSAQQTSSAQQSGDIGTQRPAGTQQTSGTRQEHDHSTTVELPFVTARFHIPDIQLPTSRQDLSSITESVRTQLPSREHSLFYGGLALGTAFAFIEWPVALAIGVGHALLNRHQHPEAASA